jgi:hypothetical protein
MASKLRPEIENTCGYCLYFKPPPNARQSSRGNCSLHKEWIESAGRTTCSEMSNRRLASGIYELARREPGEWLYIRRNVRMRTRLFVVNGKAGDRLRGEEFGAEPPHKLT